MTPSYIPAQETFDMDYPIPEPLVVKFMEWQESIGTCLPFTYKLTLGKDGLLPNFIVFNKYQRTITVKQIDTTYPGEYPIKIEGKLSKYLVWSSTGININIRCRVKLLRAAQEELSYTYIFGSPTMRV